MLDDTLKRHLYNQIHQDPTLQEIFKYQSLVVIRFNQVIALIQFLIKCESSESHIAFERGRLQLYIQWMAYAGSIIQQLGTSYDAWYHQELIERLQKVQSAQQH